MRFRVDLAVLVASVLALAMLAFARSTPAGKPGSVFSTYDTGPNGYRALYEVLRSSGVPVRRFERTLGALDPAVLTLIVTGYEDDPSAKPLDSHDAQWLRDYVSDGGRFVAIDTEFAGRRDVTPGVGTTVRGSGNGAVALARNAYTAGVERVRGPVAWVFPFSEARGVPLLANARGMVAVSYRYGRGEVIAITAPELFGNRNLRSGDNLRFVYNSLAGHGPVAFDEYVHGFDDHLSMWGVLPAAVHAAVWIVAAILLLALIGANVPFAPAYLRDAPDERDSSDYITAVAALMRRSRKRPSDADITRSMRERFS